MKTNVTAATPAISTAAMIRPAVSNGIRKIIRRAARVDAEIICSFLLSIIVVLLSII
jgi:hypothetical protein